MGLSLEICNLKSDTLYLEPIPHFEKTKIQDKEDIPSRQQSFFFAYQQLEDSYTMSA